MIDVVQSTDSATASGSLLFSTIRILASISIAAAAFVFSVTHLAFSPVGFEGALGLGRVLLGYAFLRPRHRSLRPQCYGSKEEVWAYSKLIVVRRAWRAMDNDVLARVERLMPPSPGQPRMCEEAPSCVWVGQRVPVTGQVKRRQLRFTYGHYSADEY